MTLRRVAWITALAGFAALAPVTAVPSLALSSIACVAGRFPRNVARLDKVDKGCVDDVATRLSAELRSRVILTGHADSGERVPEAIARRRVEAVRDYLVKRGIEESRITVRSVGATRPLDTGTDAAARARNRRIEIWFVPGGR